MIPKTLDEWTLPVIEELLAQGYYENEHFDFKQMLPYGKNDNGKEGKIRLLKTCCAFANSSGGFLIFGVTDDVSAPVSNRLVGIPTEKEFLVEFGHFPSQCIPSVKWKPKDQPIRLPSGSVLHVIQIYKSWDVPHCFEDYRWGTPHEWYCFTKRTNKGDEYMSYEEIRIAFLQYYEKRLKLQLLQAELKAIVQNANWLMLMGQDITKPPRLGEFGLTILETTVADTYTLLMNDPELLYRLTQVRTWCRQVNNKLQSILPIYHLQLGNREGVNMNHNAYINERCQDIISSCNTALEYLEKFLVE